MGIGVAVCMLLILYRPDYVWTAGTTLLTMRSRAAYDFSPELQRATHEITKRCYTDEYCITKEIYDNFTSTVSYSPSPVIFNSPMEIYEIGYADCDTGSTVIGNMLSIKGVSHSYVYSEDHAWLNVRIGEDTYRLDWANNDFYVEEPI